MDQADRLPLRRHPQPDDRLLAGADQPRPARLRSQFHHVIDIAPTILEAAGIAQPTIVNGIAQKPIEGISMLYTFDDAAAPDRRTQQYFEMMVNRGIYDNGWTAFSRALLPWQASDPAAAAAFDPFTATWELYNIDQDFSQANDLAPAGAGEAGRAAGPALGAVRQVRRAPPAVGDGASVWPVSGRMRGRPTTTATR